jgi:hypothetical protein
VVLRHQAGPQLARTGDVHLDWMFELGGCLRSWASELLDGFDQPAELVCERLTDHRLAYLDHEGPVAGDRGSVSRLLAGHFHVLEDRSDRFAAELSWQHHAQLQRAEVVFYRNLSPADREVDESRGPWRLRYSPGAYETKR